MKKKILFLVFMVIIPIRINALSNNDLIYGIEKVTITDSKITFDGWAYVDRKTSLGGMNYYVSIVAAEANSTISNYEYKNPYRVTEYEYTGGNMLFPITCQRNPSGICKDIFYGFSGNKNGRNYANCNSGNSCIYYNPSFSISFDVDDLKEKFKNSPNNEITFIIEIVYKDISIGVDDCKYNGTKYTNGCKTSYTFMNLGMITGSTQKIKRMLIFEEEYLSNSSSAFKKVKVNTKSSIKTNIPQNTHAQKSNGTGEEFYLKDKEDYDISNKGSKESKFAVKETGMPEEHTFRLYKVFISKTLEKDGDKYRAKRCDVLDPNTTLCDITYIWAPFGNLGGKVVIGLPKDALKPNSTSCNVQTPNKSCNVAKVTEYDDCNKIISYSIDLNDSYKSLFNDNGCSDSPKLIVEKVYQFKENVELKMNDADINDKMFDKIYNPNRGFKYKFQFIRDLQWQEDPQYNNANSYNGYFYKIRHYSGSSCSSKDTYVSYSLLASDDVSLDDDVSDRDIEIIKALKKMINNSNKINTDYEYPNVNDAKVTVTSGYLDIEDGNNIIDSSDNVVDNDLNINGTENSYNETINFIMRYARISKDGLGKKTYGDEQVSTSSTSYLDGGRKYYIPPNVLEVNNGILTFMTDIKNFSIINNNTNEKITSQCELKNIGPGKYENMRYRVIDETNPFPNIKPGEIVNGVKIATNWENLWNNSSKFNRGLTTAGNEYLVRRNNNNPEMYIATLNQANLNIVRQYNINKFYRNAKMSGSNATPGYSRYFINRSPYQSIFEFRNRNINRMSLPGESGVDA